VCASIRASLCLLGSVESIVARVLLSLVVIERVNVYMFYFVGEKTMFFCWGDEKW
jgi:hypothetical protein